VLGKQGGRAAFGIESKVSLQVGPPGAPLRRPEKSLLHPLISFLQGPGAVALRGPGGAAPMRFDWRTTEVGVGPFVKEVVRLAAAAAGAAADSSMFLGAGSIATRIRSPPDDAEVGF